MINYLEVWTSTRNLSLFRNIQIGSGGPSSLVFSGYQESFGGKAAGAWCEPLFLVYRGGRQWGGLYFYLPNALSWRGHIQFYLYFLPILLTTSSVIWIFTLLLPCIVIQILQLKPTKCTVFHKGTSTCFGPWRSIIRKSVVGYRHYGIMLMSKYTRAV